MYRKVIAFSLLAALLVSVGGGQVAARDVLADEQEYTRMRESMYNSIEEIRARLEARQEGEQPASAPVTVPETAASEAPAAPAPKKGSILDRIKGIWARSKGEKASAKTGRRKSGIGARVQAIWNGLKGKKAPSVPGPERVVPVAAPIRETTEVKEKDIILEVLPALTEISPPVEKAPEAAPRKMVSIRDRIKSIWNGFKGKKEYIEPESEQPKPALKKVTKGVLVRRIIFSGNTAVDDELLNGIVASHLGARLSLADLRALAEQVARYYHDQGCFLARVVIPQQDIRGGDVSFLVLEGRLGGISIAGNRRYREKYIRRAFSAVRPGETIRKQALERALLVVNNSSGIEAKSVLQTGKSVGATDIAINITERNRAGMSLSANNYGSKNTGRYRLTPRMTFPNVSGWGDEIGLSVISAPDTGDLLYGTMTYVTPLGARGRQLKAYVSDGSYEVGKEFDLLDIKGVGSSWGIGATYPQILGRVKSLTYEFWYEFKNSEHEMLGQIQSKDKISKLRLGLSLDRKDRRGRNLVAFNVHHGLGEALAGMPDESPLSSRSFALADNNFTKISFDYTRVERGNSRLFHIGRLSGQYSTDPLVSGEQWAIGGANSVRGHLQSTYLGDDGYTANWETRIALPGENYRRYQLVLFADHGLVYNKRPTTGQKEIQRISGVGLGLRVRCPDELDLRFDLGFPLGPDTGKDYVPYVQLMKRFE